MHNTKIKRYILIFILIIFFSKISFGQTNPLFDGKSEQIEKKQDNTDSKKKSKKILWRKFSLLMTTINKKINNLFDKLDNDFKFYYLLLLIFVSLLYGFFHAAGPGHGKSLLISYYLRNKTKLSDGIKVSFLIGLMHTFMGVIIAILFMSILKGIDGIIKFKVQSYFSFISGILIMLIGIFLFIANFFNLEKNEDIEFIKNNKNKGIYNIALVVGIVPCPMVLAISIFAISMKYFLFGVIAIIGISLGMSLFLLIISIISIKTLNFSINKFLKINNNHQKIIFNGLSFLSSILIIIIGFFILLSNFSGIIN
jgi:ABC-type nickel/cobalt efflux system permease component RcnA